MNNLSWFLYFADVVASTKYLFGLAGFGLGLGVLFFAIYHLIERDDISKWKWLWLPLIPWTIATVIPSQSTMYAIAASELGEDMYKSDIGQKAKQAIEAWINSQIPTPNK